MGSPVFPPDRINVPSGNWCYKTYLSYQFQAFAPFYNFLLRELICANGKHDCGRKLPVLNFSYHSPKPTDFLNIIISTMILLLITFSHRFVFYWFCILVFLVCQSYRLPMRTRMYVFACACSLVLINHKQKSLCELRQGESNIQYFYTFNSRSLF